jgi:hypothetical protein
MGIAGLKPGKLCDNIAASAPGLRCTEWEELAL